jgi:hypothetical protein
MKRLSGRTPVYYFYATDFDDPMTLLRFQTGGFRIDDNLAHGRKITADW